MVSLEKAVIFGSMVWGLIAIIDGLIPLTEILTESDASLLMIPISLIIILLAAIEYLREVHAQYEIEGLELATVWLIVAAALEILVFGILYGGGVGHFLSIPTWLGVSFMFVFPLAAGIYMQHTMTE